nr:MAG TPA: Replication initiator A family protein [Caudoviricetes sp.]
MQMVHNENYITIQGWMINELGLKGNSLIIYATIYGFSQTNDCEFTGSANYLAQWCGCSRQTVMTVLNKLIADNLVIKHEEFRNNVKFCSYAVNLTGCQKSLQGDVKKFDKGMSKNLTRGCQKSLHNNIDNKNSKKKSKIDIKIESIEKSCLEYDLEDDVIEILSKFFRNLLDNHKLVTDDKIHAILTRLARVNHQTQLEAIQLSLDKGYMNIDPDWLKMKSNPLNRLPQELILNGTTTDEGRENYRNLIKNNDPSIKHF